MVFANDNIKSVLNKPYFFSYKKKIFIYKLIRRGKKFHGPNILLLKKRTVIKTLTSLEVQLQNGVLFIMSAAD